MFELLRSLVGIVAPIFVISTMLNVGLTQRLSVITQHLRRYPFVLKMLLANFVLAPLAMISMLTFTSFDPAIRDGLLIFSVCAGAPFLIKLARIAEHGVALGTAIMILLIAGTASYAPIVLPRLIYGTTVDGWDIAEALALQMLLPMAAGMLAAKTLPAAARKIQPSIGRLANVSLYVLLAVTILGYLPNMVSIAGTGAIFIALAFIAAAFGIGYVMGEGKDHLQDVGGLATAQRNTAAAVIIATQNFDDPNVLVMLLLANALGIVMLLLVAKLLSRDSETATKPA